MAQVQAIGADNFTGATTLVFGTVETITSTGAGNFLCVVFSTGGNTTVTSVADNQAQSWTKSSTNEDGTKCHCWYKENSAAGVTQVTVTFSGSLIGTGIFMERDDVSTSVAFDTDTAANVQTAATTDWTTTTSATMAQNNELGIGLVGTFDGSSAFGAAGSGWTAITGSGITSGMRNNSEGDCAFVETQIFTAGGTATATGVRSSSVACHSAVYLFKLAAAGQTSVPTSDITSGWTPSTGATLYGTIDEASPGSDTDYDYASAAATMEVKFGALSDPTTAYQHQVKYRIAGASTGNLTVSLRQGSSQIASWVHTPPTDITTYTGTLTSAEADSITDYSDLRLRVVSST